MESDATEKIHGKIIFKSKTSVFVLGKDDKTREIEIEKKYDFILTNSIIDDIIYATVKKKANSELEFSLEGFPIVTTNIVEEKSTIKNMINSVKRKSNDKSSLLVSVSKLIYIYQHIEKNILYTDKSIASVGEYISKKANQYHREPREFIYNSMIPNKTSRFIITNRDISYLLGGWYTNTEMRLLKLIGIKEEDFSESLIRADYLYQKAMTDPLSVYLLPIERSIEIAKILDIKYDSMKLKASNSLRSLYKKISSESSSCVDVISFYNEQKLDKESYEMMIKLGCVIYGKNMYLEHTAEIEAYIAKQIAYFANLNKIVIPYERDETNDIVPDSQQVLAAKTALSNNITVITGAAGTGKTTIIKEIVYSLKKKNIAFACTSFTGKATARIEECNGIPSVNMDTMIANRCSYKFDALIIDEFSMVSARSMYTFFCAFPGPYKIILVGDSNQLRPIGFGSILEDIMESNTIPVVRLKVIHRVSPKKGVIDKIIENSKRISYWKDGPFNFIEGDNFVIKSGTIGNLTSEIQKLKRDGYLTTDFAIICPFKEHLDLINSIAQMIYNRNNKCVRKEGNSWKLYENIKFSDLDEKTKTYHLGDLVMCLKNDSTSKLYNGQEGVVVEVDSDYVDVKFCEEIIRFPTKSSESGLNISYITLCYALTTHKMQGSQREKIILFLYKFTKFIDRSIIYTSITRAISDVLILGDKDCASKGVENYSKPIRHPISERLRELLPMNYIEEIEDEAEKEIRIRMEIMNKAFENEYGSNFDDDSGCDYDSD
jgi:hypothetical protein